MLVQSIQLNKKNQLINEYRKEQDFVTEYFDYKPFTEVKERAAYVQQIKRDRKKLVDVLHNMNRNWDAPESTLKQIERLKDEASVVVIGGQQAGLLTGPLYSLNKLISVYRFAKEQEKLLGVPVIPIFWIAGEDHDYDEINHIYTVRDKKIKKHMTKQQEWIKKSVSSIPLDKQKTANWLREAFLDLRETSYTKELYTKMENCLERAQTFVDFFALIIFELFKEEGIVLVDSGNEQLRQLEGEHFTNIFEQSEQIAEDVYETVQTLQQQGYNVPLDVERDDVHLFYHDEHGERILLKREENEFVGKNGEVKLTKEALLHIAQTTPEKLSNNVITRPIMQELLFPTLAFIAGDGEISYWAALKKAFHTLGEKMPPVVPRLSFTYVPKRTEKLLEQRVIQVEEAIREGVSQKKMQWLMAQTHAPIEYLFEEAKLSLEKIHAPLQEMAENIAPDLHEASKTNIHLMMEQLSFLERKTMQTIREQYDEAIGQFEELDLVLHPNGGLQERVYSPLFLLNEYGESWIQQINQLSSIPFTEDHFAVYFMG